MSWYLCRGMCVLVLILPCDFTGWVLFLEMVWAVEGSVVVIWRGAVAECVGDDSAIVQFDKVELLGRGELQMMLEGW